MTQHNETQVQMQVNATAVDREWYQGEIMISGKFGDGFVDMIRDVVHPLETLEDDDDDANLDDVVDAEFEVQGPRVTYACNDPRVGYEVELGSGGRAWLRRSGQSVAISVGSLLSVLDSTGAWSTIAQLQTRLSAAMKALEERHDDTPQVCTELELRQEIEKLHEDARRARNRHEREMADRYREIENIRREARALEAIADPDATDIQIDAAIESLEDLESAGVAIAKAVTRRKSIDADLQASFNLEALGEYLMGDPKASFETVFAEIKNWCPPLERRVAYATAELKTEAEAAGVQSIRDALQAPRVGASSRPAPASEYFESAEKQRERLKTTGLPFNEILTAAALAKSMGDVEGLKAIRDAIPVADSGEGSAEVAVVTPPEDWTRDLAHAADKETLAVVMKQLEDLTTELGIVPKEDESPEELGERVQIAIAHVDQEVAGLSFMLGIHHRKSTGFLSSVRGVVGRSCGIIRQIEDYRAQLFGDEPDLVEKTLVRMFSGLFQARETINAFDLKSRTFASAFVSFFPEVSDEIKNAQGAERVLDVLIRHIELIRRRGITFSVPIVDCRGANDVRK